MPAGALAQDVATLLGGAAVVLSFALLARRRVGAAIGACAAQAVAVALAAAWQGWVQGAPHLAATALVTLAAGVLVPAALRRTAPPRACEPAPGLPGLALGVGLVVLAFLAVRPVSLGAGPAGGQALGFGLSVVLLALLVMTTRRSALLQGAGFLSVGNGLVLATVGTAGLPLAMELSVATLALTALVAVGALRRLRVSGARLDTAPSDLVGRSHR